MSFKKIVLILLTLIGLGVLGIVVYFILIFSAMGAFDKDYSVTELKKAFEQNKSRIYATKRYYHQIVPAGSMVEIEFEDDDKLARFGFGFYDSTTKRFSGEHYLEWDVPINSRRTDSIIRKLGWTRKNLEHLKHLLDEANCIQITSGEPTKIGFQRSGMGMYSFNIFDRPIPGKQRKEYNDSCTYITVDERLVLEYGGGAIGSQCFYKME